MAVILETSLGDITVDLYTEERPRTCLNFLKLCKIKYYNFCLFHSVQRNLVAQTGDPTSSGKGGSSIFGTLYGEQARYYEAELKPRIKHTKLGTLSMANNGDNMHGSQFFLTLAPDIDYLDNKHTVFGEVAEGFEVLQKFNEAFVDKEGLPYKDIRIFHTVILDDPFDDPDGLGSHIPDRSPEPTKEQLESGRIGFDENIDDFEGKTEAEVQEMIEEREAKARTQILEMVGDLPDADVAPPDTVLFVCKLNPVTTEEDLEIIFSRFGNILNCDVIKDQKTQESLQYAFIEFEKPEECENAYFKMDNVLIDDRRIHVDFSQSVSKLKWKGKGKGVEHNRKDDDDERPQFVIKDSRKKDKYELVFDDDDDDDSLGGKDDRGKKHKKKKSRKRESDSDEDRDSRRNRERHQSPSHRSRHRDESHKSKYRDESPRRKHSRSRDRYHRDRSRSRDRDSSRKTHKRDERERYRSRSRDKDKHKGKAHDRNEHRNGSRHKHHRH